jgi:hypothetical protein
MKFATSLYVANPPFLVPSGIWAVSVIFPIL